MATILGLTATDGVVLAGDRQVTNDGAVTGDVRRVYDFDSVGAAVVGDAGATQEFARRFESELVAYRNEHGESMRLRRAARTAAEFAESFGVDALVAAYDDADEPKLREVGRDGSDLSTDATALGSGAEVAVGRLEAADPSLVDDAAELARETMTTVADRDAETGGEMDLFELVAD